jgi:diacylglycerol kinase
MILKTFKSFGFAFKGLFLVLKKENNMKVHLLAATAVIATAFYLRISIKDWCLLLFAIALVLVTEIINTSIEKLVDMVSPERDKKAGAVKDMAAAAVLVASFFAFLIGVIIFWNKVF